MKSCKVRTVATIILLAAASLAPAGSRGQGTQEEGRASRDQSRQSGPRGEDVWTGSDAEKIAGLATIWAEAKYAFPSFEQVPDLDWDASFREFIPRVVAARDMDEYYWILMEFAALLNDGHTGVLPPWGYLRPDYDNPPIEVQVIDEGFVVARTADSDEMRSKNIYPGLRIQEIEGMGAADYLDDRIDRFYPRGSRHANEALNIVYLLRGPAGTGVSLKVEDLDGTTREVVLTRNAMQQSGGPFFPRVLQWMMAQSPIETEDLENGVLYIRLAAFEQPQMVDTFFGIIDRIAGEAGKDRSSGGESPTTGIIIDMRFCLGGNSAIADRMIGCLIAEAATSPEMKYPHYVAALKNWGHEQEWTTRHNVIPPRDGNRYLGPVVILSAGTASSTAEDFMISLRYADRAVLVGERTAGSAGHSMEFPLPGGGTFRVATFRALLPDGGEYVGIGVKPDIEIIPSREDIATGRDPVLEKAIGIILEKGRYEELLK